MITKDWLLRHNFTETSTGYEYIIGANEHVNFIFVDKIKQGRVVIRYEGNNVELVTCNTSHDLRKILKIMRCNALNI